VGGVKRYRFPLETVLRVRRIERDRVRGEVAAAEQVAARAAEALRLRESAYRAAEGVTATGPATRFLAEQASRRLAADVVVGARDARVRADAQVIAGRAALAAAASAVAALEELQERGRTVHHRAALRHEAKLADDLVTSRVGGHDEDDR
jgi:flagellar FliJ protein